MDQVFTREHILRSVANSLLSVSKDLYNLKLDELSEIAVNFGIACFDKIDEQRQEHVLVRVPSGEISEKMFELGDRLVKPYEPKNVGIETDVKSLGEESSTCQCKIEECGNSDSCNGHVNLPNGDPAKTCIGHVNPADNTTTKSPNIESEVTEIVAKIRSKM